MHIDILAQLQLQWLAGGNDETTNRNSDSSPNSSKAWLQPQIRLRPAVRGAISRGKKSCTDLADSRTGRRRKAQNEGMTVPSYDRTTRFHREGVLAQARSSLRRARLVAPIPNGRKGPALENWPSLQEKQ